jgi:hypothetical protein
LEYKRDGGTGVQKLPNFSCGNSDPDVSVNCRRDDPRLQEPAVKDLTYKRILALKPGRHWVADSLYVQVSDDKETRRFMFPFTKPSTRKPSEKGLGLLDRDITLREAKDKRDEYRKLVRGGDPVEAERKQRVASVTFADVANEYIGVQAKRFRNPGSVRNVTHLLLNHASGLGQQPIASIGTAHIDATLRPLWQRSPEQARRAVAAVLRVLKYAKAKKLTTTSAADVREDMTHLLPHVNGTKRHFAAMDYKDVLGFMHELHAHQGFESLRYRVLAGDCQPRKRGLRDAVGRGRLAGEDLDTTVGAGQNRRQAHGASPGAAMRPGFCATRSPAWSQCLW